MILQWARQHRDDTGSRDHGTIMRKGSRIDAGRWIYCRWILAVRLDMLPARSMTLFTWHAQTRPF